MIKYPGGITIKPTSTSRSVSGTSTANRGMSLEHDLNLSNQYYNERGHALITKRPTPINIVKVDYTKGARITDAYFEKQSTTDYNGIYRGKYLDFEAKSTLSKNSFPLSNIYEHQFNHLRAVVTQGGLAFFIIRFTSLDETYLVSAVDIIEFKEKTPRKSVPLSYIKEHGYLITEGYAPRLNYLAAVDQVYFSR